MLVDTHTPEIHVFRVTFGGDHAIKHLTQSLLKPKSALKLQTDNKLMGRLKKCKTILVEITIPYV
ncbi:MAG: hypothetical protein ACREOO_09050 [bacterium]